ncbi:hypothetical protein HanRHA438_Chr15g0710921 [Helianthus annuus]|nr:hypothetical protein HanRHA438_Chr15g0710921 [Helianthus annuus]
MAALIFEESSALAASIFKESTGSLVEQGSVTSDSTESRSITETVSADLQNTEDLLRSFLHSEDGHWLSSVERCSRMH